MAAKGVHEKQEAGTQLDTEADGDSDSFGRPDTAPALHRSPIAQQFVVQIRDRYGTALSTPRDDEPSPRPKTSAIRLREKSEKKREGTRTLIRNSSKSTAVILVRQAARSQRSSQHSVAGSEFHRKLASELPTDSKDAQLKEWEAKQLVETLNRKLKGQVWYQVREIKSEDIAPFTHTEQQRDTRQNSQPLLLIRGVSCSAAHSKAVSPQLLSPMASTTHLSIPTLLTTRDNRCESSRQFRTSDWVSISANPATVKVLSTKTPSFCLQTSTVRQKRPATSGLLRTKQETVICTGAFRGTKVLPCKQPGVPFPRQSLSRPGPNHFLTVRRLCAE